MKQRYTSLDIRATVNELNDHLSGKYLQNFYSTQQRFMFIKFSSKDILLIEPGMRLHLSGTCGTEISHFCKKLRETCRHAKVNRIYQHGFDRIVVIDILRYKLVIELFSAGNIIIIDSDDMIVDIHRPVPELGMIKKNKYVWNTVEIDSSYDNFIQHGLTGIFPFEKEFITILQKELHDLCLPSDPKDEECRGVVEKYLNSVINRVKCLGWYGEVVVQKGTPFQFYSFNTTVNEKTDKECVKNNDGSSEAVKNASELSTGGSNKIIDLKESLKDDEITVKVDNLTIQNSIKLYSKDKITSLVKKSTCLVRFESFNAAAEYALSGSVKAVKQKVDKAERIKTAQTKYIGELTSQADCRRSTVQVMEENREFLGEVLAVFKKVRDHKMEWKVFDYFYEEEKRRGNPIALSILSYDLKNSTAILQLCDGQVEDVSDKISVEIDTSAGVSKNIENYYVSAKKAEEKAKKTTKAMENLHAKTTSSSLQVKPQKRTPYWFEKYNFFITTDGILVIAGRNFQDNEYIVKNHLEKNDLYFHCDVHGASSVVCKGRSETAILETGYMALCFSKCWEDRVTGNVFYVEPQQVSKTAPSGEYLPRGSFMISGKKNFISIHRLEYGVGILFREEDAKGIEFATVPGEAQIVHAMPVAAPWCVVKNYRYRVRLCPGGTKKTQVANEVMKQFWKLSEGRPEEVAVKSIGIDEYMKVLPSKTKISKEI